MQNQFNQIIPLLQNKKFEQAIKLCQNLLQHNNHPQLHLFLAIAFGENEQFNQSKIIFENLIHHFPKNHDIRYNYALILQKHQLFEQSISQYQYSLQLQPNNASAWNNLGEIQRNLKSYSNAIQAYEKAIYIHPDNLQYSRNLGICLYQDKQFERALPYLDIYIKENNFELEDCSALIDILITLRKLQKATDIISLSINKFKDSSELYNLAGLNELEKRKFNTAITYLKKALEIDPLNIDAQCHLASAYAYSGNLLESNVLLNKISKLNNEPAQVYVAMMHESNNNTDSSLLATKHGLELFPNNIELKLIHAKNYRKNKEFDTALKLIESLLKKNLTKNKLLASVYFEKGLILEKLQKYSLAWEAISIANKITLDSWNIIHPNKDSFSESCHNIVNSFKQLNLSPESIENKTNEYYGENLVFIIGFPRSGTTLLDSILSAHSDICVLEEAPIIGETYEQIENITPNNYASKIASLKDSDWSKLRLFYFNQLKNYSNWNKQGLLIDKSPLNTMHVGFIHSLFPKAKIIFSLRHPLDVCLSCFFQDFKMNSFMTNFTTIESTAKTYNSMLDVLKCSENKLNIPIYYQSYEKLVHNFEPQIKKLISFLNIPWQENLLKYEDFLTQRGTIATPSYNQVNQGIYQTSENKYKKYLDYLNPVIKILSENIDYFNYRK